MASYNYVDLSYCIVLSDWRKHIMPNAWQGDGKIHIKIYRSLSGKRFDNVTALALTVSMASMGSSGNHTSKLVHTISILKYL